MALVLAAVALVALLAEVALVASLAAVAQRSVAWCGAVWHSVAWRVITLIGIEGQ